MKVITKAADVILAFAESVEPQGDTVILDRNTIVPSSMIKDIIDVEIIPVEVEPIKYCCLADGEFHLNPNYKENYSSEERIAALEDAVNMLLGF